MNEHTWITGSASNGRYTQTNDSTYTFGQRESSSTSRYEDKDGDLPITLVFQVLQGLAWVSWKCWEDAARP